MGEVLPLVAGHAKLEPGPLSLAELDSLIVHLREERTAANGARTRAKKTIEQLTETLPPEPADSPETALKNLRALHADVLADLEDDVQAIRDKHRAAMDFLKRSNDEQIAKVRRKAEHDIEAIRVHLVELLALDKEAEENDIEALRKQVAPQIEAGATKLGALEEQMKGAAGAKKAREMLDGLKDDLAKLETEWRSLDNSVKGLEELKTSLLSKLPIEGVTIDGGKLSVKDEHGTWVLFDALNTAAQIKFAVRLAAKRAEAMELPAILCDGLERLDPKAREAFLQEAERSGCQFLVTFATDDEALEVKGSAQ